MNEQPSSGNRWEPRGGHLTPHVYAAPSRPAPTEVEGVGQGQRAVRGRSTRMRTKAVGAAAALFLLSGAGGFAVAHAVSHAGDIPPSIPGQGGAGDHNDDGSDHGDFRGSDDDGGSGDRT